MVSFPVIAISLAVDTLHEALHIIFSPGVLLSVCGDLAGDFAGYFSRTFLLHVHCYWHWCNAMPRQDVVQSYTCMSTILRHTWSS